MAEFRSQFRLPQELADSLKQAAVENHRSLNAEIVDRLEQSFASRDSGDLGTLTIKSDKGEVTVQADKAKLARWLKDHSS